MFVWCLVSFSPVNEPYGFLGAFNDLAIFYIVFACAIFDDVYFVWSLIESNPFSFGWLSGLFEARLAFQSRPRCQCWKVFVLKHWSNDLFTLNPCWPVEGHAGIVQYLFGQLLLVLVSVGHRSQEWRTFVGEIAHSVDLFWHLHDERRAVSDRKGR